MFSQKNRYMFSYEKKRRARVVKRILTILLVVALVIGALIVALSIYSSKIRVDLVKDRTIEVNTKGLASMFIDEVKNGRLVEDQEIDTSVLGEQRCTVKIELEGNPHDFTFTVNVVDTEAPKLKLGTTEINVLKGGGYDVLAEAEASDNSGEKVEITVEGDFDPNKLGQQVVAAVATDSSGNRTEQPVSLNVIDVTGDMPDMNFFTRTGHQAELKDGFLRVDGLLLVNRSFPVPADYAPNNDASTTAAFNKMALDAANKGLLLIINRQYRSYDAQAQAYAFFSEGLGEGENTTSSIKPGHSEHQTGLAIDVNTSTGYFADTSEGKWLKDNCQRFGFILRYPEGKEEITGCAYEPWHIRYVGKELAEILYNEGDWITLEEYFGLPSEYVN